MCDTERCLGACVTQIGAGTLDAFLARLEQGYSKHCNPYHNLLHAADVAQTLHHIISKTSLSVSLTIMHKIYSKCSLLVSHCIIHKIYSDSEMSENGQRKIREVREKSEKVTEKSEKVSEESEKIQRNVKEKSQKNLCGRAGGCMRKYGESVFKMHCKWRKRGESGAYFNRSILCGPDSHLCSREDKNMQLGLLLILQRV